MIPVDDSKLNRLKIMHEEEKEDELRSEYDLTKLKVRRVGEGRKQMNELFDMRSHYDFDYSKAKPNRFAEAYKKGVTISFIDDSTDSEDCGQSDFEEKER